MRQTKQIKKQHTHTHNTTQKYKAEHKQNKTQQHKKQHITYATQQKHNITKWKARKP